MCSETDSQNDQLTLRKYPSLNYPSHEQCEDLLSHGEIVFIEKLDGANFRFRLLDDETLLCGSRNVLFKENGSAAPLERVNENFRHTIRYLYKTIDFEALRRVADQNGTLSFHGESMHKHSIDYDAWEGQQPAIDGPMSNFVLFDIWSESEERWLSWDEVLDVSARIGLQTPKEIGRKPASEVDESDQEIRRSEFREPDPDAETEFDRKGLAEGIVVRNDDLGIKAKLVHEEFKEVNAISFNDASKAHSESGRFVATYCTDARIRKIAYKLVDDPESDYTQLEMPMMEDLPKAVLQDLMEENAWEILNNDMELAADVKGQIRSKASKKCVRVLKNELNTLA
jgi:hypothetical protein